MRRLKIKQKAGKSRGRVCVVRADELRVVGPPAIGPFNGRGVCRPSHEEGFLSEWQKQSATLTPADVVVAIQRRKICRRHFEALTLWRRWWISRSRWADRHSAFRFGRADHWQNRATISELMGAVRATYWYGVGVPGGIDPKIKSLWCARQGGRIFHWGIAG